MPYALLALVLCLALTAWFVVGTEASTRSKAAAVGLFLLTLFLKQRSTPWYVAGLLLQAILSIAIVLYCKLYVIRS